MALVEAIVASKLARWSGGHVFESLSRWDFFSLTLGSVVQDYWEVHHIPNT